VDEGWIKGGLGEYEGCMRDAFGASWGCMIWPSPAGSAASLHLERPAVSVHGTAHIHLDITARQGLTLVHFSAQRRRFLWDRGAFRGCLGGV
jgi:hypothetical protein